MKKLQLSIVALFSACLFMGNVAAKGLHTEGYVTVYDDGGVAYLEGTMNNRWNDNGGFYTQPTNIEITYGQTYVGIYAKNSIGQIFSCYISPSDELYGVNDGTKIYAWKWSNSNTCQGVTIYKDSQYMH